jgi:hypothetical protein
MIEIINKIFDGDVLSESRNRENVYARIAYSNYMKSNGETQAYIARKLSKKNETVAYYCKQHNIMYDFEKVYRIKYDAVLEENQNN